MEGFIVKHTHHGIGKILSASGRLLRVGFLESGAEATFEDTAFVDKELRRHVIPMNSECSTDGRLCVVKKMLSGGDHGEPRLYSVKFISDGLETDLPEDVLTPTGVSADLSPLEKLINRDPGSYNIFAPRERLLAAVNRQIQHGRGVRALLSSRIDLHPHQAFVAGLVLLDDSRRYLLADEVGLGKTIEAGIVLHDLLINKPDARILVVCPNTLTQQWLCEIYSKFSGHVFRMMELVENPEETNWETISRLIVSFGECLRFPDVIKDQKWDMVVVDEVHNVLSSENLYGVVKHLSTTSPAILLLSALPARRREDEFLKLLTLLDPERYTAEVAADPEAFVRLFDSQRKIGRKLRLIRRRLEGISTGDFSREEAEEQVTSLLELDFFADDARAAKLASEIETADESEFLFSVEKLLHHVGDAYRINRRILRNRRQRLIEDDQIPDIHREVQLIGYKSEQFEYEVNSSIGELLANATITTEAEQATFDVFARLLFQSAVHPFAVLDVIETLNDAEVGNINARGREFLELGYSGGNVSWDGYITLLCRAVRRLCLDEDIANVLRAAQRWARNDGSFSRLSALTKYLKKNNGKKKVLIFSGFPKSAELVFDALVAQFGTDSATCFLADLEREEKEANVQRFRTDSKTWLLISDESGGEGRNFQFADELVHFDTPWEVSRVEQRIGRLDRLGRQDEVVRSIVVFDESSPEAGLIGCYENGLGVYKNSISGLEFALRNVTAALTERGVREGVSGLRAYVEELDEIIEEERGQDDSEAILDEASFDRKGAEQFLRVRSSAASEIELEEAFVQYFGMIANGGVKKLREPNGDDLDGFWCFHADRIHQIRNEQTNSLANRKFIGTFRRELAQTRSDLEFFGLGNPLFEAMFHSIHGEILGRTYAVEIRDESVAKWMGFEFVFVPSPDLAPIGDNFGLKNRAREYFDFQPTSVFCSVNGEIEANPTMLARLRSSLTRESKEHLWTNFTKEKALALAELEIFERGWESIINDCHAASHNWMKSECGDLVAAQVSEKLQLLRMQLKTTVQLDSETTYVAPLKKLIASLSNWTLELDSVGFLSVNGRLFESIRHG